MLTIIGVSYISWLYLHSYRLSISRMIWVLWSFLVGNWAASLGDSLRLPKKTSNHRVILEPSLNQSSSPINKKNTGWYPLLYLCHWMVDGGIKITWWLLQCLTGPKGSYFPIKKESSDPFFLDPWRLLDSGFLESMCSVNVVIMFHWKHEVSLGNSMLGKSVNWTFVVCSFLLCNMIYININDLAKKQRVFKMSKVS